MHIGWEGWMPGHWIELGSVAGPGPIKLSNTGGNNPVYSVLSRKYFSPHGLLMFLPKFQHAHWLDRCRDAG